jgi:N-acetylneuraminate synthase
MEIDEKKKLVKKSERDWQSLEKVFVGPIDGEKPSILFRRSLCIVRNLKAGDVPTKENVRAIPSGQGIPPKHLDQILRKKIKSDVKMGTALAWSLLG